LAVYAKTETQPLEAVLSLAEAVVAEVAHKMRALSPNYESITTESASCLKDSNRGKDSRKL
jgi:hypothetical protein